MRAVRVERVQVGGSGEASEKQPRVVAAGQIRAVARLPNHRDAGGDRLLPGVAVRPMPAHAGIRVAAEFEDVGYRCDRQRAVDVTVTVRARTSGVARGCVGSAQVLKPCGCDEEAVSADTGVLWTAAVKPGNLPELRSFAAGIRRDLATLINGLTVEHASGTLEGDVSRIKRLNRDGCERAAFELLRTQIPLATCTTSHHQRQSPEPYGLQPGFHHASC